MAQVELKKTGAQSAGIGGAVGKFFRKYGWSYVFVLPSLIAFSVFTLAPAIWSFIISFQDFKIRGDSKWVGFQNYVDAFTTQNGVFVEALRNTAYYAVVTVTVNVFIALILASLIQPLNKYAQTFFRAAYYLPAVTSAVVIAVVWRWMFNTQWGFLNYLLSLVGLPPVLWLADPDIALNSVILSTILTVPATGVVLFSAAMGSVPKEYYEAADLEGASVIRKWWSITLPLIKATTLYVVVLYTIASFEIFEKVYIMVPSGVGNSTQTIVTQIYQSVFQQFRYGVASAQSIVLFIIIALIAIFQFRFLRTDVEY
ncbi:MAG TPA: sugar ABC transporter permease [Chloroflexia bacterium]|nr:sugar ABC transporter permease [Chloroflexia bacterium]